MLAKEEAVKKAKQWYTDRLEEESDAEIHTKAESYEEDDGWYIEVWSDALPSVLGVFVHADGRVEPCDET